MEFNKKIKAWWSTTGSDDLMDEFRDFESISSIRQLKSPRTEELNIKISSMENGIFCIEEVLSLSDILYIFSSEKYSDIREIRHSNWKDFKTYESKHEDHIQSMRNYLGVEPPIAYWQLNHFWESADMCYYASFRDAELFLNGLDEPIVGVLSKEQLEEDSILHQRRGIHELNYIPAYNWMSDGVTQGFAWDLQAAEWSETLIYSGDGDFKGEWDVWSILGSYTELVNFEPMYIDDEFQSWQDYEEFVNGTSHTEFRAVIAWFLDLIMVGFANNFDVKPVSMTPDQKAKHGIYNARMSKYRDSDSIILSESVYPHPILDVRKDFHKTLCKEDVELLTANRFGNPVETSDFYSKLSASCKKTIFNDDQPADEDAFWRGVSDFSLKEVAEARPWLATLLIFCFWDNCTEDYDARAIYLMKMSPRDLFPKFIERNLLLHSKTRYDGEIKW